MTGINYLTIPPFSCCLEFFSECYPLGVARGLLQEGPLQFQHKNVRVKKVGNTCPSLDKLLASRILYVLLVGEKQHEIARARFCTQSCSKVVQLLVNSSPTLHPMEVAGVFLAVVLWQHLNLRKRSVYCFESIVSEGNSLSSAASSVSSATKINR